MIEISPLYVESKSLPGYLSATAVEIRYLNLIAVDNRSLWNSIITSNVAPTRGRDQISHINPLAGITVVHRRGHVAKISHHVVYNDIFVGALGHKAAGAAPGVEIAAGRTRIHADEILFCTEDVIRTCF